MNPRGETGTVLGLPSGRVRDLMLEWYDAVFLEAFTPRQAREFFRLRDDVSDEQADALVAAYLRMPGIVQISEGQWRATEGTRSNLEWRDWRLATGRLDLPGVRWLIDAVNQSQELPPDSILALRDRCRRALEALELMEGEHDRTD